MKRSGNVATAARAILDADDFVTECRAIVERYRKEHEFDVGRPSVADTRRALQQFSRHVDALVTWCERASRVEVNPSRPEQAALLLINALLRARRRQENLDAALAELVVVAAVVPEADRSIVRHYKTAAMVAADWLQETFKTRGLESPTSALTAELLHAIALAAGNSSMTLGAAKRALVQAGIRAKKKPAD